jgi:serine/threonine protein kinase
VVKTTSIINRAKPRAALFSLREALSLVHLPRHDNIPQLLDFSATPKETHLILELAPGEELFSYVNNSTLGRLGEAETRKIVRGILEALRHAHENGVLHRDIKLDNCVIDGENGTVSLIDFGLATFFDDSTTLDEAVGCINYASPQLLRLTNTGTPYSAAHGWSDLWALGILMHGLLSGFFPFRAEEPVELEREIRTTWMNASELEGVPSGEVGRECRRFLHTILNPSNEGRLTAADLLAHPWLSDASAPLAPVEKTTAPLPRLPMSTKDHRRLARLDADQIQARLPEHRRKMARELLGDDAGSLASTLLPSRTPSPAISEATAMELDEPELVPSASSNNLFASLKSASSSFSSLKSTASTDSQKSAVRRWFAKLSGRQ